MEVGPLGGEEVVTVELMNGIGALTGETHTAPSLLPPHEDTELSQDQEAGLTRHRVCWCLDLGLPRLQPCETEVVFTSDPISGTLS